MLDRLYNSVEQAYTFAELNFPTAGVEFSHEGQAYRRPHIAFNMVSSVDGKASTSPGGLVGLGSRTDRNLMSRLRSQFDAVLVGGGTLRVDPFIPTVSEELSAERSQHFPSPQPLGMVLSNSGDLPLEHRFWQAGKTFRVVLLGEKASQEQAAILAEKAQVYRVPSSTTSEEPSLAAMLNLLFTQLNVKRLLVEGGPSLNYSLISQGWGDELFLSLSPRLVGGAKNFTVLAGEGYGMGEKELPQLSLRSIYHHESELFLRYQISYIKSADNESKDF